MACFHEGGRDIWVENKFVLYHDSSPHSISYVSFFYSIIIMPRNLYASVVLLLLITCVSSQANAQTVTFNMNVGEVVIELLPNEAPVSVANFLGYVNRGDYEGTLIHRSVPGFVVQGGGFIADLTTALSDPASVSTLVTQPTIMNEFGRSNLRGTVAYARLGGNVDSATSQFFFNLDDSNSFLDDVDEGFTVFAEVVSGMDVVDDIAGLQRVNAGGAFGELPLRSSFDDITINLQDLVVVNSVTVFTLGDVNLDNTVDFLDISPFIDLLSTGGSQDEADIDRNGVVNFLDIAPFIVILSGQ